eukprot:CAMPEP_0119102022 /NCGR_PEP_ID=MMETSP1180-20130426/901_1 /TAXON_ID=3052 ORGANISM="Chlamydomonas cf sp, Strain CCMP681" /NCGR_SAMPLE_ID=MMETSP1180 /ASSEMBLY_ACC=CAM_ASM_000741 /LENGTH=121 /DNA_ID=CAMNT_0007086235 /DNA_START=422 /DNA_END=784 /DNA_ORIENTATION=-
MSGHLLFSDCSPIHTDWSRLNPQPPSPTSCQSSSITHELRHCLWLLMNLPLASDDMAASGSATGQPRYACLLALPLASLDTPALAITASELLGRCAGVWGACGLECLWWIIIRCWHAGALA